LKTIVRLTIRPSRTPHDERVGQVGLVVVAVVRGADDRVAVVIEEDPGPDGVGARDLAARVADGGHLAPADADRLADLPDCAGMTTGRC
jgi:hypothetical protein